MDRIILRGRIPDDFDRCRKSWSKNRITPQEGGRG